MRVEEHEHTLRLQNDQIDIEVNKRTAELTSLRRVGKDENLVGQGGRGYYHFDWYTDEGKGSLPYDQSMWHVVRNDQHHAEVAIVFPVSRSFPMYVDMRYVLRDGECGFHYYGYISRCQKAYSSNDLARNNAHVEKHAHARKEELGQGYKHPPVVHLSRYKYLLRANPDMFNYRFVHDDLHGELLPPEMIQQTNVEANKWMNETYQLPDGRVWAKHAWMNQQLMSHVVGMSGDDVGLWMIRPSFESFGGTRPAMQTELIHETKMSPVMMTKLEDPYWHRGDIDMGEGWEKVYGPFFVYVNSGTDHDQKWKDAKREAIIQRNAWPYEWVEHPRFLPASGRGTVSGQLHIKNGASAAGAWIILAHPRTGEAEGWDRFVTTEEGVSVQHYPDENGDWQRHVGPYLHWVRADDNGHFELKHVHPDTYRLFAWVPGVFGEFQMSDIAVHAGQETRLGTLNWTPVQYGNVLWEIGKPDRTVTEFKNATDRLLGSKHRLGREWPRFLRYAHDFPDGVHFVVGESKEAEDWHFMHLANVRVVDPIDDLAQVDPTKVITTQKANPWTIEFNVDQVPNGMAHFTIAVTSSRSAALTVHLNEQPLGSIQFSRDDKDDRGAGIRSQLNGWYNHHTFSFQTSRLREGTNTICLVPTGDDWLSNMMYDYLRFEIDEQSSR